MTKKPTNLLPLDGNDPAARLRFIETYGADAYNVALQQWMDRNTMSTVNGYPIRRIVWSDLAACSWSTAPSTRLPRCTRPRLSRASCQRGTDRGPRPYA